MPRNIGSSLAVGLIVTASTAVLHIGNAAASESHRHHHVARHPWRHAHVAHARRYAYPPYPRSDSLWALYQYLKDGTEWCWLPTEPCDNNHRMTN